jgi:hypothetical protein
MMTSVPPSARVLAGLVVATLGVPSARSETLSIDHAAVSCVVAGKFPRLDARFAPPDALARAKVLFQPEGARHWYAVAMKADGALHSGVLPRPRKDLKAFRYYIEATEKGMGISRTVEYTTTVVDGPAGCRDGIMAGALGSATVALEIPAGAPAVPVGFSSSGVAAAGAAGAATAAAAAGAAGGGGIPAAVLIGGAVAVAGGAAVAVAAGGGGPSTTIYTGSFGGQWTVSSSCTGGNVTVSCTSTRTFSGTVTARLKSGSDGDLGQIDVTPGETEVARTGPCTGSFGPLPTSWGCRLTGTASSLSCRQEDRQTPSAPGAFTSGTLLEFSGALSGGVITGTMTFATTGDGNTPGGVCTQRGSTSFPITLR